MPIHILGRETENPRIAFQLSEHNTNTMESSGDTSIMMIENIEVDIWTGSSSSSTEHRNNMKNELKEQYDWHDFVLSTKGKHEVHVYTINIG